jgi:hypothetical protein
MIYRQSRTNAKINLCKFYLYKFGQKNLPSVTKTISTKTANKKTVLFIFQGFYSFFGFFIVKNCFLKFLKSSPKL